MIFSKGDSLMSAEIKLDLAHAYRDHPEKDEDYALLPLRLTLEAGKAYALLGPSGCGKTTTLNIISGLLRPSQGKVCFDGIDVTAKTPQERNIAQVFQFPVVYDTMTVAENLAFPLRNRKISEAEIKKRVGQIAEMLELNAELDKRAADLSADIKQKISLGRGLVRPDVAAILFDEPLTVIDPHLKWHLRQKLKQIHRELKLTLIYVTHDQVEALTFAQEIVVMSRGRVVQVGSAEDLFERPQHLFVGHFIGSPGMNFLPVEMVGEAFKIGSYVLDLSAQDKERLSVVSPGDRLHLGIRPEYLQVLSLPNPRALSGRVLRWHDLGTHAMVVADCEGGHVHAHWHLNRPSPAVGDMVYFEVLDEHTRFYCNEVLV